MKSNKLTSLLCALALTGAVMPLSMAEPAPVAAQEAPAEGVNYTDALMKGLSLTLPDVQSAVESGTFKNLSPEAPKPAEPEPAPLPEPEPEPEPEEEPAPEPEPVEPAACSGTGGEVYRRSGERSRRDRIRWRV